MFLVDYLTIGVLSDDHRRHRHRAGFAVDHHDAGIRHVPAARAVGIEFVTDVSVFGNTDVLIQDGAANLGVAADITVIHDDGVFHAGAGVDADAASENGVAHNTAGENASGGYDAVNRLTAAMGVVEGELGGRVGIIGAAQRPLAVVEVEGGLDGPQVHVGFVVGIDGADISPIGDGVRLAQDAVRLEVVSVNGSIAGELGQNVIEEIVETHGVIRVRLEQIHQRALGENVIAHGGVDLAGIAGDGGRIGIFLVKGHDASILAGLNDAEFAGVLSGCGYGGDRHLRVPGNVEGDHAGDVHAVDVIGAEDGHHVRVRLLDEIDVLQDSVGRTLVPGFGLGTHLRRYWDNKVARQQSTELPYLAQMLKQRLAAELGEHIDRVDSGIDEIAEDEIDDPVRASEGNRWLGAIPSEGKQAGSLATGEHNAQNADAHGTFRGEFE